MTAEEFEQVKECARGAAVEQIHDFIILMVKEGKEDSQDQEHGFAAEVIREELKRYRFESAESTIRKYVDWLVRRHAELNHVMQQDDTYSIRHNAMVLEYIVKKPMSHVQIEKKLGISDGTFKRYIDICIHELADILFLNYISDNSV